MSEDECPFGGDITDDCDGCADSGEFHFNPEIGECVKRTNKDKIKIKLW